MESTETKAKTENKEFEISYLVRGEKDSSEIFKLLKQHDFEISFESQAKRITLAYKIKKEISAYFGFARFKGDPAEIKSLNHDLESSDLILRFLIIASPFVQTKTASQKPRPVTTTKIKTEFETKPNLPLSNEALEKKIEEILQ